MKIKGTFKAIIAGSSSAERKDGSGRYYNISIIDCETSEAGMLSCDESVFNTINGKDFKRFSECVLHSQYDSVYKSMRVVGIDNK